MYIRMLNPADAEPYRALRLQALQLHPEAFLSSYEEEKELPLEVTRSRLEPAEDRFTLGGYTEQGELAGVVTFIRESREKLRHKGSVFAMYVSPAARRRKLGHSLDEGADYACRANAGACDGESYRIFGQPAGEAAVCCPRLHLLRH